MMMRTWFAVVVGFAIGCGSSGATHDSGVQPDGPKLDAPPPMDANLTAPTDTPAVACTDTAAMVYAATAQTGAAPGTILACAPDAVMTAADAQTAINKSGGSGDTQVTATSDVKMYRVAYQTRDGSGGTAVTTSRVYLPSTPRARPVPIVVTAHGSVGLADSCVSSATVDTDLPLTYAARGFAAIAPDGSGLGNAGTQDYLNNKQQGQQLLDGFRALRALLAPGITAKTVILTGYSQGGGAALSAQSLFRGDGADLGTLAATVVYAPEWPIRLNSFQFVDALNTSATGFTNIDFLYAFPSVWVLRQYAFWENHIGVGMGKTTVASNIQASYDTAVQSDCLVPFGLWQGINMVKIGDLMTPAIHDALLDCINSNGSGTTCTDPANADANAYYKFLNANFLTSDPQAGPVLMMIGLADTVMLPASEGACVHQKLVTEGVNVSTCVYLGAQHTDITHNKGDALNWVEATLDGTAQPGCSADPLPTCTP